MIDKFGKEWFEQKCFIARKPAETKWSIQELDETKQKYKDKYEELLNVQRWFYVSCFFNGACINFILFVYGTSNVIYKITIEYEVEALTQLEAFRKIRDEKQLVYKHIKTKEQNGLQSKKS